VDKGAAATLSTLQARTLPSSYHSSVRRHASSDKILSAAQSRPKENPPMKFPKMAHLAACAAILLSVAPAARAGEKTLMHCFAWTAIKDATPADWQAFYAASDALPAKIKGVTKVWFGKLKAPLHQVMPSQMDPATVQKFIAGETVTVPVKNMPREYGMCIEMTGPDALQAYGDDPYHKIWNDAYAKVHVPGTTTVNILGQ
jgi:hypothetical protein